MSQRDFDWIDDAFDDKRTAEDMANAQGSKLAGLLLVLAVVAAAALVVFGFIGIVSAL